MPTPFRNPHPMLRVLSLLLVLAARAGAVSAADLYVNRYDDPVPDGCENAGPPSSWDCSLREAIIASRDLPTDDRIFLSAGVYELTRAGINENAALTGDLDVTGNTEILGAGPTMTTIDANGLDRVFHLVDSPAAGDDVVKISGVALTGGDAPDTTYGGAILTSRVELTVESCEIFDNGDATGEFGSIYANLFTTLTMRNSTIHDNFAGGVSINQSSAQILNSTISDNGTFELGAGGGSEVLCTHCTLQDSTGNNEIVANGAETLVQLANTAILGGCTTSMGGVIQTLGGNLEAPDDSCGLGASDLENVALPGYGVLLENGGDTPTHFPSPVSPGVGNASATYCAADDQRGVERTNEESCEVGSVERTTVRPLTSIFHDGFRQGGSGAWSDTQGG